MKYRITSKAGFDYGVYEGETPEDAFRAMAQDGGRPELDESIGTADDWTIDPTELDVMKITLRQDWQSMIENTDVDTIDVEATQRAYEAELRRRVLRDYPNADVEVEVSEEYFRLGTEIEGVDDLSREMTEAHCGTIADQVWSEGSFWRDHA